MARTVLIVDDDSAIRETFAEIVAIDGYEAQTSENGAVALRRLKAGLKPALILLDLMMPVMDGYEFRAEQLKDPSIARIPVVVLSAAGRRRPEPELWASVPMLKKPPELEDLLRVIRDRLAA